ncbi:response regulator transcription factor [uncultured Propionibacterium sp.]|uniref:response regulator transcription factor n=1 Tax=uncultured Propionibacterium sp. TaxID=218066 RepID=UPI002930EB49|nr:response regulator transcription factor [uncultured Propionibacterium sp.]
MIVDDHELERFALSLLVRRDPQIDVVAEAGDGQSALDAIASLADRGLPVPDVVLMDVRMPGMDGTQATRRIIERFPGVHVLILTTYDQDDYAFKGLSAGAMGFLLKDARAEDITHAVHALAEGEAVLTPRITREVLDRTSELSTTDEQRRLGALFADLSPRERQVVELMADGRSNSEIADAMVIQEASVRRSVSRILTKTGLRDRVQIISTWYKAGR